MDGFRKWPNLLTFNIVFMLTYVVGGWVRKSPNYADVIYVWPLAVVNLVSWVGFHSESNPLQPRFFMGKRPRIRRGFHSAPLLQINTVQFIPFLNLEYSFTFTMRINLLNWCNLVSISKKVVFYAFGVVRIY